MLCAFGVNYTAASGRTDRRRYGPALEIVDRPSANLARLRGTKTGLSGPDVSSQSKKLAGAIQPARSPPEAHDTEIVFH